MTAARSGLRPAPRTLVLGVLQALAGAFAGLTLGGVVCALLVPGDFFDLGDLRSIVGVTVAAAFGAYGGFRIRTARLRVALGAATALAVVYWVAAPDGWWASPPPNPGEIEGPR